MESKRGLSAVVASLLIILLVLVAIGIIWVVVRNVIDEGAQQVDISSQCTAVDVEATAANCADDGNTWACNVTYKRNAGGTDIDGLQVVLSNGLTSFVHDVPGNVAPLATSTEGPIDTGIANTDPEPNSVQIAVYFNDDSGNARLCNPTGEREF